MKKKSRIMAVLFCLILITILAPISASAANNNATTCPKCGKQTLKIRPLRDPTCVNAGRGVEYCGNNRCQYEGSYVTLPATGNHSYSTYYTKAATCQKAGFLLQQCSLCNQTNRIDLPITDHSWYAPNRDCTIRLRCSVCFLEISGHSSHTFTDSSDTTCDIDGCNYTRTALSKSEKNIEDMNRYAFKVYLVIRSICVPLAIVSLASCGFTFLGSIFFGNYSSMAGGDMMKAKKQAVYTVLAIMFIVLLPKIFSWAIDFFSATGWSPASSHGGGGGKF